MDPRRHPARISTALRAMRPTRRQIFGVAALQLLAGSGLLARHAAAAASEPTVTIAMTKELSNIQGKEGMVLVVTYPPGGADPLHRHDAHGFIYVLEGSVVMGSKGRQGGHAEARADLLRRARRHPHGGPKREQYQTGKVRRVLRQRQGRASVDPAPVVAPSVGHSTVQKKRSGKRFSTPRVTTP